MKKQLTRAFTYLISFAACVWLFSLAYKGQDFAQVWFYVQKLDLFWVGAVFAASIVCHSARSLRWQLLLETCGYRISFWRLFFSLMSGYFVNQALPRGGEIVRCYLVKKSDNVGYGISIGSVLAERAIDTFCLALLLVGTFLLLNDISYSFFHAHINTPVQGMIYNLPFWKIGFAFLIFSVILLLAYRYLNRNGELLRKRKDMAGKLYGFGTETIKGALAVLKLNKKYQFLAYTFVIWLMYFLMTYLWFFSLEETSHFGVKEAFFIWAIGSIGRLVPVQGGGAGAYHYLVIQAFLVFGAPASVAGAMALVIHGLQTVIYVIIGSVSLLGYLLLFRNKSSTSG